MNKRRIGMILGFLFVLIGIAAMFIMRYMEHTVISGAQKEEIIESSINLTDEALLERGCDEAHIREGYKSYYIYGGNDSTVESWYAFVDISTSLSENDCAQMKVNEIEGFRRKSSNGKYHKLITVTGENEAFVIRIALTSNEWKNDDVYSVVSQILGL